MNGYLAPNLNGNAWSAEDVIDRRPEAARKRLRECKDRASACEAIREIVSNLLGCEEMALFQWDGEERFSAIWSFGVEPHGVRPSEILRDSMLSAVIAGKPEVLGQGEKVRAVVPIRVKGETAGVLVLVRLLPQKSKIDELDRELFAVLSAEAGRPLFDRRGNGSTGRERKR